MSWLQNHPFAVEAFFKSSVVLSFAVPKSQLQPMIPPRLQLDTFEDKWAFIAVAMVQTTGLRPKGFPAFMGNNFFLIGYRIFVRYQNLAGKNLRGLYILQSATDKKKMEILGNIFTHYNYTTTDINQYINEAGNRIIASSHSKFNVAIAQGNEQVQLPAASPFTSWKEARRFAGPLPFTFTFNAKKNTVLIIEGVRENWVPTPIEIATYDFEFINKLQLQDVVLANAFEIKNVPYYWKKGSIEKW
jgi:hypothetical protein